MDIAVTPPLSKPRPAAGSARSVSAAKPGAPLMAASWLFLRVQLAGGTSMTLSISASDQCSSRANSRTSLEGKPLRSAAI